MSDPIAPSSTSTRSFARSFIRLKLPNTSPLRPTPVLEEKVLTSATLCIPILGDYSAYQEKMQRAETGQCRPAGSPVYCIDVFNKSLTMAAGHHTMVPKGGETQT
jgi:hypothetical protein